MVDTELTNNIMQVYDIVMRYSNEFSILSYEIYSPDYISATLDDLYEFLKLVSIFKHNTQLPEITQLLIDYFENS